MHDDVLQDKYESFEEMFNPLRSDRRARRQRRPDVNPMDRIRARRKDLQQVSDLDDLEGGFNPTYKPSRYESGWLLDSLRGFYDQKLISDVLALVRGGKEASVYRCAGHPTTGETYLAAKVYRPRQFRDLSNDALYKEGRQLLTAANHVVRKNEDRVMRAVSKKSAFGQQVAHTSWLMHEFSTLQKLHADGAAVPKAFTAGENAILMAFIGDASRPAPALNEVALASHEVLPLFDEVMRNVELLLRRGLIHGDLSAYNILYQEGRIALIDFPQVVALKSNSQARAILVRDVQRVCEFFATQGLERDPDRIAGALWARFRPRSDREIEADNSRFTE